MFVIFSVYYFLCNVLKCTLCTIFIINNNSTTAYTAIVHIYVYVTYYYCHRHLCNFSYKILH